MITEFLRVVRPGGKIFLTVWALEQENPEKTIQKWHPIPSQSQSKGKDYFVPWHLPLHRPETAAAIQQVRDLSQQAEQHGEIIKEKNTVMFKRFYHVFEQNELSELVASVPGAVVLEVFYDKSNWCISFMKRP